MLVMLMRRAYGTLGIIAIFVTSWTKHIHTMRQISSKKNHEIRKSRNKDILWYLALSLPQYQQGPSLANISRAKPIIPSCT
jgi:hypothetical protein